MNYKIQVSVMQKLLALVALSVVAPTTVAGNIDSQSRVQDGRVQLILTNTTPETLITLERVEVPVSLIYKKDAAHPTGIRTVPVSGPVGERTIIDIGSVEEVFNGGGAASDTVAHLNTTTTTGMTKCLMRHTPVTVLMQLAGGSIRLMHAVPTTFCHPRVDGQEPIALDGQQL
jgi:hypothetical protein